MLVLQRKQGDQIMVYDKDGLLLVTIIVTEVHSRSVKLGFDAPTDVKILRGELGLPKEVA